jgi:hypothetical protein
MDSLIAFTLFVCYGSLGLQKEEVAASMARIKALQEMLKAGPAADGPDDYDDDNYDPNDPGTTCKHTVAIMGQLSSRAPLLSHRRCCCCDILCLPTAQPINMWRIRKMRNGVRSRRSCGSRIRLLKGKLHG